MTIIHVTLTLSMERWGLQEVKSSAQGHPGLGERPRLLAECVFFLSPSFGSCFLPNTEPSLFRAGISTEVISSHLPTHPGFCLSGQVVGCPRPASGITVSSDQYHRASDSRTWGWEKRQLLPPLIKLDGAPFFLCRFTSHQPGCRAQLFRGSERELEMPHIHGISQSKCIRRPVRLPVCDGSEAVTQPRSP